MKKLLGIVVLGLLLSGSAYAKWLPNEDKDFFISCSAKGYLDISYKQQRLTETILDEYKITIGKDDILGRFPKSVLLVNTNANKPNDFNLHRKDFDQTITYSDRIMIIDELHVVPYDNKKMKVHQEAVISLISGVYEIFYKDALDIDDTVQFKGIGACEGLVPVLSYLENNSNNKGSSSGTAFFISKKGHLLTNNHVVEGCSVSKITYQNKDYDTKLLATDKTLDLALLKTKVKPKSYISFSKKDPKKRQQIIIAGYPLGKGLSDDLKINDGRISSIKGFQNNSNEITVDVAINPGNSGGPIVNEKGQLVAIAVSGMSKEVTEGINFGIKASAAKNFLKLNKISPSAGYINFSMDDDEIVDLLEESTVYTYCN